MTKITPRDVVEDALESRCSSSTTPELLCPLYGQLDYASGAFCALYYVLSDGGEALRAYAREKVGPLVVEFAPKHRHSLDSLASAYRAWLCEHSEDLRGCIEDVWEEAGHRF